MKMLLRLFAIENYEITDVRISMNEGRVTTCVKPLNHSFSCHRCGNIISAIRSRHHMLVEDLPIMSLKNNISFFRRKGFCSKCKKVRSEAVPFLSEQSPHMTKQRAYWLAKLCEIASVKGAANWAGVDKSTLQRLDLNTLKMMLKHYKIPKVTHISVDEVYATRKSREGETRDDRFFTVITDLKTKRVIWVSESRRQQALDQFFELLGKRECNHIEVVATDQHKGYQRAVEKHCPNAILVWDRFHIMKGMNEALNDCRKLLLKMVPKKHRSKLLQGKYRFVFLKKAARRSSAEAQHIEKVKKENEQFISLELIKERMYSFFDAKSQSEAIDIFREIGLWVRESGLPPLKRWYFNLQSNLGTLLNYFIHRVSTSLSEGINNVIKALKRQAFGYRNKLYFRLKIMQKCGYLNSTYAGKEMFTIKSRAGC